MNLLKIFLLSILFINLNADENTLENVTLQLQWKNQFEFAGFYAAKEKGFYKDVGLHVKFKELKEGEKIVSSVLKGDAQYGLAYSSLIADYMNGKPLVLVANFFKQSPLVLITQKNIKLLSDLKGKRVMGLSDSIHYMTLLAMLGKFNLKLSDVKTVPTDFNIDDFIDKKVDAMSVFTTNEIYTLDKKGIKYNIFDPVSLGEKYYDQNLFTTKKELLNHYWRVEKFKEASIRGWKYALAHKNEIINLILKKYNTQHKSKEALLFEAKQIEQIMLPKVYPVGSIDPTRVQMIADGFIQAGFVKKGTKLDIKDFIYGFQRAKLHFSHQEKTYLRDKKEIKMCIDPNWMPFEAFDKSGKYIGMTSDFFQIFSKSIGVPIKVVKTKTWDESLKFVRDKKCDILSLAMETPKRDKYLNFTKPYFDIPLVIATKPNVTYIDNISLLKHKKIGIVKEYAFNEILRRKYPDIEIVDVKNTYDGLQKVADGKLFGFVGSIATIGYEFQTNFTGELKISGKFDQKLQLGIGVRKDDKKLLEVLEKAVEHLSTEQKQSILNKHIAISYKKGFNYSLFWKFLAFAFTVVLVLLYKQYVVDKLNKELRQKFKDELERSREKDKVIFHQSKLIAMGEMIENIAHQWRQPLSQVNSAVLVLDDQLYKHKIKDDTIDKKLLEIESLTKYMSQTIDDFKNFFDMNKRREYFLLHKSIKQSIAIIEPVLSSGNIEIITIFEDDIVYYGYPNELQQVVTVILNNAKDVLINNDIPNPKIRINIKQSDKYNRIFICDNGGGIKEENLEKIFEPYFTTKHKSQGAGVGLYFSKIIVEDGLNGKLLVENIDKGACFSIVLKREDLEHES